MTCDQPGPDIAAWAEADKLQEWFTGTDVVLEDVTMREIEARFTDVGAAWRYGRALLRRVHPRSAVRITDQTNEG